MRKRRNSQAQSPRRFPTKADFFRFSCSRVNVNVVQSQLNSGVDVSGLSICGFGLGLVRLGGFSLGCFGLVGFGLGGFSFGGFNLEGSICSGLR